jgi:hypothetical protein
MPSELNINPKDENTTIIEIITKNMVFNDCII